MHIKILSTERLVPKFDIGQEVQSESRSTKNGDVEFIVDQYGGAIAVHLLNDVEIQWVDVTPLGVIIANKNA